MILNKDFISLSKKSSWDTVKNELSEIESLLVESLDYLFTEKREILVKHLQNFDWRVPDWRNAENYPDNQHNLKDWQWKWECVRRETMYKFAYLYLQNSETGTFCCQALYDLSQFIDPRLTVDSNPFESHLAGQPLNMPSRLELEGSFFSENGILETDDSAKLQFLIELLDSKGLLSGGTQRGGIVYFPVDLHKPLNPQKYQIDEWIKGQQKLRGPHGNSKSQLLKPLHQAAINNLYPNTVHLREEDRGLWGRYLRVIDADDHAVPPCKIYETILGDELDPQSYDKVIDDQNNASQAGRNWVDSARAFIRKAAAFL